MDTLAWIVVAALLGGVVSVVAAALVGLRARPQHVPVLISFAIGALLGAAFLDVLPQAILAQAQPELTAGTVLAGILGFFVLEKLVLWRHCHEEACEGHEAPVHGHGHGHNHDHDHGRSGMLIMVGDTFHNFVDGVLIAAAFMQSVPLGVVTAMAIIAHEIPQELGDFLILLHSGYSRARALALNLLSSLATLVGGVLAYFALSAMQGAVPVMLSLAAASMIYVAVADLIPGLHRRRELAATLQQVVLIALGIGAIILTHHLVESFHV
jgi:zinc and cadmium transporter